MFCKHVDFIAVFVITLGLLGVSQVRNLRLPETTDPIRLQNVNVNIHVRPLARQILSNLDCPWNR
jgi:hypothetical protein